MLLLQHLATHLNALLAKHYKTRRTGQNREIWFDWVDRASGARRRFENSEMTLAVDWIDRWTNWDIKEHQAYQKVNQLFSNEYPSVSRDCIVFQMAPNSWDTQQTTNWVAHNSSQCSNARANWNQHKNQAHSIWLRCLRRAKSGSLKRRFRFRFHLVYAAIVAIYDNQKSRTQARRATKLTTIIAQMVTKDKSFY